MQLVKKALKLFLLLLSLPIIYIILGFVISYFTIDKLDTQTIPNKTIYLSTNGVHLDLIIPVKNIDSKVLYSLKLKTKEKYIAFGWGEENFYLNTPTWKDLSFAHAFKALFLKNNTVMHLVRYKQKRKKWIPIKITEKELQKLNTYIHNTFALNENGTKQVIKTKGYSKKDDFYKAIGRYSLFKTCNTWVNKGFKESGLKSCYWTPFDFGLLNKYR